jgi:hypothetical protein
MTWRLRALNGLSATMLLLGMVLAFPGCMLILAADWFTDHAKDHEPGRF